MSVPMSAGPAFSIIIPTRNRPDSFRAALDSVLAQSLPDLEIIVVNDGSDARHMPGYEAAIAAGPPDRLRCFTLPSRSAGHGGSYARNFGVAQAIAPYVGFLDDDDVWTDPDHLSRARGIIASAETPVDLYLTHQAAFQDGRQQPGPIWIEDLPPRLRDSGNRPDQHGVHTVTAAALLQSQGFCHLNTLIVRRALYLDIGGLDERNSWEHDRDLYLRLIDCARLIKYAPVTIARHNIPDPAKAASVTTTHLEFERRLSQLRLLDRAILSSQHAAIRAYGRRHKAYTLKKLAQTLAASGRHGDAAYYAREALGAGPTFKWAAYAAWYMLRAMMAGSSP